MFVFQTIEAESEQSAIDYGRPLRGEVNVKIMSLERSGEGHIPINILKPKTLMLSLQFSVE